MPLKAHTEQEQETKRLETAMEEAEKAGLVAMMNNQGEIIQASPGTVGNYEFLGWKRIE